MNNMDKKTLKVKRARRAIQGLALAIGLSSILATSNIGNTHYNNADSSLKIEHDHDCDCAFCDDVTLVTEVVENKEYLAKNDKTIEVKEFTQENTEEVEEAKTDKLDININNYQGSSIVEALALNGYESSFSYRKDLAIKLGITDYSGTAEQNIKMIELLNKKANEDLNTKKANDNKKNKGVKIQEIAAYLATIEGQTFNLDKDAYDWAIKNNIIIGNYNYSLNKQDLCNVLINYASYKGVNINNVDNLLNRVVNSFKDNQVVTNNINNIARAYFYGYIDIDKNNKVNAKSIVTSKDVNYAFTNLINDINIAIKNNNVDEFGKLIIVPSEDKYNRDSLDTSLINYIRKAGVEKPVVPSTPEVPSTPSTSNDNRPGNGDEQNKPTPEHHHHYSAWRGVSDTKEERTCSCGHKETRGHVYGDWYSKDENTEGCKCSRCGWEKTRPKEETHTHDWGEWQPYNETQCISYCNKPGCNESKKQSHDWGATVTTHTDNHDGTHETVVKHTCKDCGYEAVISRTNESCSYSSISYSEISGTKQHNVSKTCTECGHVEKYAEDCDFGSYSYDASAGVDVSHCSHCSNIDEKAHTHHYGSWEKISDDECQKVCEDCNHPQTQSHNFVDMGEYEECSDCGYKKQKTQHSHTTGTKYENYTNDKDSYCCDEIVYCIDPSCGEEISKTQIGHNWTIRDESPFSIEYICTKCGVTKEEMKLMSMMAPSSVNDIIGLPVEPEEVAQDPENQEQLPEDPENQEQHPINDDNINNNDDQIDQIIEEVIQEVINEQQNENQNQEEQNVQNDEPQESDGKTLELIP